MDETEIELRDVTQYLMPPPHSSTERVCLATRWAGIFLSTTALEASYVRLSSSALPAMNCNCARL